MSNPLLGKQSGQPDMNTLFQQFKANPMKYLTGMDLPQGVNSPEQIVRHLASAGKIPPQLQARVNAMLQK